MMRTLVATPRARLALALIVILLATVAAPAVGTVRGQGGMLQILYLGTPGSDAANGALLAIEQINSVGGFRGADGNLYTLELLTLPEAPTAETLPAAIASYSAQNIVALLGPDSDALLTTESLAALIGLGLPVLTGATGDALTSNDTADVIFRLRAPEQAHSAALATYMLEDLGLSSIALVQTTSDVTAGLLGFLAAMDARGISPAGKVQLSDASRLIEEAQKLIDLNPEAVAMWGPATDASTLLSLLRKRGWQGVFAYREADAAARAGALPEAFRAGVLGVTSWSYAYPGRAARIFLKDYIATFGEVPGPLAAAAYDAMWYLRAVVQNVGPTASDIRSGLLAGAPLALVGGQLHGAAFGNGDLIAEVMVYTLEPGGGSRVVARFAGGERLPIEDAGNQ